MFAMISIEHLTLVNKMLKQHKSFFILILVFILFFSFVLIYGAKRIYNRESKWRDETGMGMLQSGSAVIETIIYNLNHQLLFLRELPIIDGFVESKFKSPRHQREVQDIFLNFASINKEIYQIVILDRTGHEKVIINNLEYGAVTTTPLVTQNKADYQFYSDKLLDDDDIYYSSIELNNDSRLGKNTPLPELRLATLLVNGRGDKQGVLILTINFSEILKQLPKNMFVQTQEGWLLALKPDGSIQFKESDLVFNRNNDQLRISSTENIHYSTLEFSENINITVALHHSHIGLKASLQRLILFSTILLTIFLIFVGIISYLNISRFRGKNRAQRALISSLVELTDWRDPDTGIHLQRTSKYSQALSKQLKKDKIFRNKINAEFIKNILDIAPLHDIGKVGIKDAILLKAGKLDAEEYEEMKKHVLIGQKVIQDVIDKFKISSPLILMARNICGYHHEKYNGCGYPEGLKASEIPLEARIFSLADVYDALRTKRPYKNEMAHSEVVAIIQSEKGKHFDPDVVEAFLRIQDTFAEINYRYSTELQGTSNYLDV